MTRHGTTVPIQVLVVSHATVTWGAERYLLALLPLLRARDVELTLAAPPQGDFARRWSTSGGRTIALERPASQGDP